MTVTTTMSRVKMRTLDVEMRANQATGVKNERGLLNGAEYYHCAEKNDHVMLITIDGPTCILRRKMTFADADGPFGFLFP